MSRVPVCPFCQRVRCICPPRAAKAPRSLLAAVAAAGLLLLAGCGSSQPHGTVTGKDYEAARTTWHTVTTTKRVCTTSSRRVGKSTSTVRSCRTVPTGIRRVAGYRPACWQLELSTGDEVCVSEHTWRTTHVGDHY
ncbi:hypothetical protein ACFOOM_12435 [Streptomyces echinoruber]|uniref:Lipoprotein n=1 Tax=Streptomyces echinoruber TaxID=68898 RepID=A0A918RJB1_9ACTN|nr:hypothetical protein [Streptomyces echinoruber]GHA01050.1 hypothetical protein GCM10010389_45470 [Streptomyces echinoruber]